MPHQSVCFTCPARLPDSRRTWVWTENPGLTSSLPCFFLFCLWTQVIFRNEVTSEFLYYTVSFRVIPSGIIKTIQMTTSVRQNASASIKLENPLPYSVTFSTECKLNDISLPSQFAVPANSEVRPWLPGDPWGQWQRLLPMRALGLCSAALECRLALVEGKKNGKGQSTSCSFLLQPKSSCELGTLSFGMDSFIITLSIDCLPCSN